MKDPSLNKFLEGGHSSYTHLFITIIIIQLHHRSLVGDIVKALWKMTETCYSFVLENNPFDTTLKLKARKFYNLLEFISDFLAKCAICKKQLDIDLKIINKTKHSPFLN